MRQQKVSVFELVGGQADLGLAKLDLVVPFTDPRMTGVALVEASRLARGLRAEIRVVKVQVVPYPMSLDQSPVSVDFQSAQLTQLAPGRALNAEVRYAREIEQGLESCLNQDSIVILAAPRSLWPSGTVRLAKRLRRDGYTVILVSPEKTATSKDFLRAEADSNEECNA